VLITTTTQYTATHLYFTARTDSDFYPLWDGKISVNFETKQ